MVNWNNKNEVKDYISLRARQLGMPESFIPVYIRQLERESGLMHYSNGKVKRGGSGEYGIGQLMPETAKSLGVANPSDPVQNIDGSIKYMVNALAHYNGDASKALMAYNAGFGAVDSGRIPKQSVAYAQGILGGTPTGAAAPVPTSTSNDVNVANNIADLYESQISDAEKLIKRYFTDKGYNDSYFQKIKKQSDEEIQKTKEALDKINMEASPEKVAEITNRLDNAKAKYDEKTNLAIEAAQQGVPLDKINNYVNMFKNATNENIQRMQEANPYTRMAQEAPIDLSGYNRAMQINNAQQDLARGLASTGGVPYMPPADFAARRMQEAQARQAEEMARRTGLTPEQFLSGATADYNTMGSALNNQQQVIAQLYNMAAQGDINARNQLVSLLGNQANAEMTAAQNMQSALNTADANAFNRAQLQAQNILALLGRQQNLYGYPLQADTSMQANTQNQIGATLRQGMSGGNAAAGQYLNYQGMLQKADAANQPEVQDPYKAVKDFNTMKLNALGMSANVTPEMLGQAIDEARGQFAQANPSAYNILYPNAPANYTQFTPFGQSTMQNKPQ